MKVEQQFHSRCRLVLIDQANNLLIGLLSAQITVGLGEADMLKEYLISYSWVLLKVLVIDKSRNKPFHIKWT